MEENNEDKSNMKKIEGICKEYGIDISNNKMEIKISNETLKTLKNLKNLIEKINKVIDESEKNGKLVIREPLFRTCENFTIAKKGQRTEEILERMIVKAWKKENNDNLEIADQFSLNGEKNRGKESIDIILYKEESEEKVIHKIIELKYKLIKGKNTPLYGIIELIKNYLIIKKGKIKIDEKIELILLAPKFFYESFENDYLNSIKQISDFLTIIGYPIYIKYLDITEEEVKEAIKIIGDKDGKETIIKNGKKRIKNISDVGDIKEKLQFDKWKDYFKKD